MEAELLQGLQDVGYSGPLLDESKFSQALQGGAKSPDFTNLVSWLTDQIGYFGKIDETVHPTTSPEDASGFLLEISTFLKELECVNSKLTTGNSNQRFASLDDKYLLLEYLISELMAIKISEAKIPEKNKAMEITISESITAKNLRETLTALKFQKPPDNISPEMLFQKLNTKITEIFKQIPKELVGKPLFFGELSNEQWDKLDKIQADLNEEYTIRREMLLKRLDVTINSFTWSERIKPKEDELNKCYHHKRDAMNRDPDVTLAALLAARDDLAIIEKTSSASVRKNTRSAINKVIIGAVPDRGGRSWEQEPPPPEMPPWQKDRVPGPPRGGFSGGGGGRGGGRGGGQGGRGGGGYRDNKSSDSNFGQNLDTQKQFSNYGNQSSNFSNQGSGAGYGGRSYSGGQNTGYSGQGSGYSGQSSGHGGSGGYSNNQGFNSSGYSNPKSGYNQSSGYSSQSSGYGSQGSSYSSQGSSYGGSNYNSQGSGGHGNRGGYDRKSGGGDYRDNRGGGGDYRDSRGGGHGRGGGGRVQGGWNQDGSSNRNQGRRY